MKLLDKEIKLILKEKNNKNISTKEIDDAIDKLNEEIQEIKKEKRDKKASAEEIIDENHKGIRKCKYYNTGFCKYRQRCRFKHPEENCKDQHCGGKECPRRHPKQCKWSQVNGGCRRQNGVYLHEEIQEKGSNLAAATEFECAGCKSCWTNKNHVVGH